ncbi:PAS domain S-box protein [Paraflavisolibacter sp. H34]|uniref:PAS domain S-box protein n=1 Tax=Huijunlia imazamoxiresistens TaxID=3127457 RepID=UPI00301A1275
MNPNQIDTQAMTGTADPEEGAAAERKVVLLLDLKSLLLTGDWQWDLSSPAICCSDVILSHIKEFRGTQTLIHPDDLPGLKKKLPLLEEKKPVDLSFRVITTYGEVKTLQGLQVVLSDEAPNLYPTLDLMEAEQERHARRRQQEAQELKGEGFLFSERIAQTGNWFINASTHEASFSDQVFRLFGLAPQSLNPHPNTFLPFLHPDDREPYNEAFNRAYNQQLPLHVEFRILRADGQERLLRQTTQWSFSSRGEYILLGVLQDITEEKERDRQLEQAGRLETLLRLQLRHLDQSTHAGHWFFNPLTRQTVYSDNCFRLFGLRPQSITPRLEAFVPYLHPDDQPRVEESLRKMRHEHTLPDLEFRIQRPDGKIRFLQQTGKPEVLGGTELVIFGTLRDLTHEKVADKKLRELQEKLHLLQLAQDHSESLAQAGNWTWAPESGRTAWSDNLFRLLGYKPGAVEPDQQLLLKFIHPTDRERYTYELNQVLAGEPPAPFELNLWRTGETIRVKVLFALHDQEEKKIVTAAFQDVTTPHRQHRHLADRLQLAELLAENVPDRVMITDPDHNIIFWNHQCEAVYKLKKSQVLHRNLFEILPQLKETGVFNRLKEALEGKTFRETQLASLSASGFIDLHLLPMKTETGEVAGVLQLIRDVSEDVKLKESLAQRLSFIESLLQATVDRIVVLDRNMNYVYWNRKSEEYYGLKKEQVIGKNILEVFPQLLSDPSYTEFRRALRGETVHVSAEQAQQDGCCFETWLVPVKNEKEEVSAVLWITHDFTSEFKVREEQKMALKILDTIEEACIQLNEQAVVTFLNQQAEAILNGTLAELAGKSLWEAVPQIVDTPLYFGIHHALATQESVHQADYFSPWLHRWHRFHITPCEGGVIVRLAASTQEDHVPKAQEG